MVTKRPPITSESAVLSGLSFRRLNSPVAHNVNKVGKKGTINPKGSADPQLREKNIEFLRYVKSVYRVLLTRGMKGCYIYFMDKDTESFFKSRINIS